MQLSRCTQRKQLCLVLDGYLVMTCMPSMQLAGCAVYQLAMPPTLQDKPSTWGSWTMVLESEENDCQQFMELHGIPRRTAEQLFGLDILADVSWRAQCS